MYFICRTKVAAVFCPQDARTSQMWCGGAAHWPVSIAPSIDSDI